MNYYPNGKGGYSVYDDNWNQMGDLPAKPVSMREIMEQYPLGQAQMPTGGASGAQIGAVLGKGLNRMMGSNRAPKDDQVIGAQTGEFVVNKKAAERYGYGNLEAINNLGKGDINPTTYGPTSPGATSADKREFIGSFDNPLQDKTSVAVNPRNPWGIKPGPGVRLNIDGRLYNVDDYTHPRVPANTVDFYHGYQRGGAVQPWWARRQLGTYPAQFSNNEFGGRRGGYGIQPRAYGGGGSVEPPVLGGNRGRGREHSGGLSDVGSGFGSFGNFDFSGSGNYPGRGYFMSLMGGGYNQGFNWRPWLDKGSGLPARPQGMAQGGVVGDFDEYRIGGRVGGRRGGGGGRGNMMMSAAAFNENPSMTISGGGRQRSRIPDIPGWGGDFPPGFWDFDPPNPPNMTPPTYTPPDMNPAIPQFQGGGGGGYDPGFEGVGGGSFEPLSGAGVGTIGMGGSLGPISGWTGTSTGDYVRPFWANR